jgi:hypothetical protein
MPRANDAVLCLLAGFEQKRLARRAQLGFQVDRLELALATTLSAAATWVVERVAILGAPAFDEDAANGTGGKR